MKTLEQAQAAGIHIFHKTLNGGNLNMKPKQPTGALRAVIYLRVSTDEQRRNGRGLDEQRDSTTGLVSRNGYTLAGIHTDAGISGTKPVNERP
ncbi:MAG TPA: recombinase family protein, partial [Ktedonobacterales bacterium]|nr:recombinase family protein [Ktedonobacterales bacterium]